MILCILVIALAHKIITALPTLNNSTRGDNALSARTQDIDKRIYDLYDEYCHGKIARREFLRRASLITIAGISGLTMAQ